jgi:hypothetical protein
MRRPVVATRGWVIEKLVPRRADIHLGLLQLACALICYRHLPVNLK